VDLWTLKWAKWDSSCGSVSTIYPPKATFNELCSKMIMVYVQVPHATELQMMVVSKYASKQ